MHTAGTNSSGFFLVGGNSGVTGIYDLHGTGSVSAVNAYVGCNGDGSLVQSDGTFFVYGDLYVGVSGSGSIEQSGGTATIGPGGTGLHLDSSSSCSAIYNLTAGTLVLHGLSGSGPQAEFNFGSGILQANGALSTTFPMTLTGTGGNANVDTAGYAVTLSGQLSGPGGLNKLGSNTLTLSAINSFTGDTTIHGGTLVLAKIAALQGSTLDYDNYGGTLSSGSLTTVTLGGLKGSQNLSITNTSSNAVALSVGGNGQSTIYSGQLSGKGALKKIGEGVLTLAGNNSYLGTTTVSAGTLTVANLIGSATGSGSVTVDARGDVIGPWLYRRASLDCGYARAG